MSRETKRAEKRTELESRLAAMPLEWQHSRADVALELRRLERGPLAAREPALAVGVAAAVLLAAIRMMGWLTPEQEQAWLGVAVVAAPIIQGAVTRRYVSPARAKE